MDEIDISLYDFKERLKNDPRIGEEYVENIELPQAFATGNKFLRNLILDRSDYKSKTNLPSDWFQFSQTIENIEVNKERLKIEYDPKKDTHPPILSRRFSP